MCEHGDTVNIDLVVPGDLAYEGYNVRKVKQIDRCIAPIVAALNNAGIIMRGSCCGHGKTNGEIILNDGRTLVVVPSEGTDSDESGERKPRPYLARIKRETSVEGMRPIVTLTLLHDDDSVELMDGDEFVTVGLLIDPWGTDSDER